MRQPDFVAALASVAHPGSRLTPGLEAREDARKFQRALIKEYSLNHNTKAPIIEGIFLI